MGDLPDSGNPAARVTAQAASAARTFFAFDLAIRDRTHWPAPDTNLRIRIDQHFLQLATLRTAEGMGLYSVRPNQTS